MSFRKIIPRSRAHGNGLYNITYRNGTFRMNKKTVDEAGVPEAIDILIDDTTKEVMLKPVPHGTPGSHHLSSMGKTDWPNAFSSVALSIALRLPRHNKTARFFTTWDPKQQALIMNGGDPDRVDWDEDAVAS